MLIAVDNVHSERTDAIFYVIPEFDWLVNDRLNKVEESI
jgi:hypothetical protein